MKISGLEKLTLTDYPGKLACIVFTQGCNFKCPFCQNSTLIECSDGLLNEKYIFDYLNKRKNVLEGVVITGGEPTIQKDIKEFIKKVKKLGLKVKLDTNGNNYKVIENLLEERLLDYIAMDVKSTLEDYETIAGTKVNIQNIKKSIEIIKNSKIDHEFRTTIIKDFHTITKIKSIIGLLGNSKYYLQNFQDSEYVIDKNLKSFTEDELKMIKNELKEFSNVNIRGL